MYVSLQSTTDPTSNFTGLERLVFAREEHALRSLRTAWLEQRPAGELSELGVPSPVSDEGTLRYWELP